MGSGPEAELKGHGDVRLATGGEQGNPPALILNIAGKTKTLSGKDIGINSDVVLAATLWDVAGIEYAVAKFEADFSAWA